MPSTMVAPPWSKVPPLALTPLTVVKSLAVSKSETILPSMV